MSHKQLHPEAGIACDVVGALKRPVSVTPSRRGNLAVGEGRAWQACDSLAQRKVLAEHRSAVPANLGSPFASGMRPLLARELVSACLPCCSPLGGIAINFSC